MIRRPSTFTALAAAGLLTASFGLGHLTNTHAQSTSPAPAADEQAAPPAPPRDGPGGPGGPAEHRHGPKDGPGPRGERPPHPPRPDEDREPAKPVDPQAAPVAVKTAGDVLAGLTVGQVWTRTAPRGEQQTQASLVYQGKEVARLDFDPATGALLARGQHLPPPPPAPGHDAAAKAPAASDAPATQAKGDTAVTPVANDNNASAKTSASAPVKLDQIKSQLPGLVKGMVVSPGAEVMPREGFWKVALVSDSRVVGELHFAADGKTVLQDFGATRDAATFAK